MRTPLAIATKSEALEESYYAYKNHRISVDCFFITIKHRVCAIVNK